MGRLYITARELPGGWSTADDYGVLEAWMQALPITTFGGTSFDTAFAEAAAFFAGSGSKRRIAIFVTDGFPQPASSVDAAEAMIATLPPADIFGRAALHCVAAAAVAGSKAADAADRAQALGL